jgi:tRNA(Ile2) C34 agmatinyltransferase TiaS
VIYIGIDDTDTLETPGTNQLARVLVSRVSKDYDCVLIVRHQLLFDPRIPYTSKNGSASIVLKPRGLSSLDNLIREFRLLMLDRFNPGSDPGLCVTTSVCDDVREFGLRCKRDIASQEDARQLAAKYGLHLEGLGGTEGGVIGALAAVGLIATGNDGRVVQHGLWPDDLSGQQDVATLHARGVEVKEMGSNRAVTFGTVDVGVHLRPNYRERRVVLFVTAQGASWQAERLL